MLICKSCGQTVADNVRFCSGCGAAVERHDSTQTLSLAQATTLPPDTASSSSSVHGRFEPGTKLGERYRIVGLLGRGGMGEVYRADDLELGQSVALKFLPEKLASDPGALDRFRNEVRTARQVAHPNVCRMYDIAQHDGHVFLSMEYIDGEDLAHVLRRMGRPTTEKALEIARQLCLGLAAAHENGVLHRDLKPANLMIDGRGRVRITDFGLAGLADELGGREERAGTPAYMAPEQLSSGSVSVRSDIYALGLVLHEVFTGKKLFDTNNVAELKELHQTGSISLSSSGTEQIDPAVERAIQRCLEQDPQRRPSSVYAVLGALPGADPLAAALAAGETPSPELLAEVGESGGLNPRIALALLAAGLAVLGAIVWIAPTRSLLGYISLDTPQAELALRARDFFKEITGESPPKHEAFGFARNEPYLDYIRKNDDSQDRWDRLGDQRPPALTYWHRFSRKGMTPTGFHSDQVVRNDPPFAGPRSTLIEFDPQGRLVRLRIIPDRTPPAPPADAIDVVDILFERAGLDRTQFTETDLIATSPVLCDDLRAYSGPYGLQSKEPVTVQVGSFRGRANYLEIIGVWDSPNEARSRKQRPLLVVVVAIVVLVFTLVIASRNLKQNRSDRKGAFRLALFTMLAWLLWSCLIEFRLRGSLEDVALSIRPLLFGRPFGHAIAHALLVWLAYVALEPYARRLWPRTLVTWTRLLIGRVRDPQLGRDILIGGLVGGALVMLGLLWQYALPLFGQPPTAPTGGRVGGLRENLLLLVELLPYAVGLPLSQLILLVICRLVLRVNWAAIAGFVMISIVLAVRPDDEVLTTATAIAAAQAGVHAMLILVVLVRFGVCALLTATLISLLPTAFALTPDLTHWYAAPALVPVFACAVLLAYGFYISLAGQPLWRDAILER